MKTLVFRGIEALLIDKREFTEVKRPEHALQLFICFALAKGGITYGMELMLALLEIIQGIVSSIMNAAGLGGPQTSVFRGRSSLPLRIAVFWKASPFGR